MPVPASGWTVQLTHPTTSRTIQPRVLSQPTILPSLNRLPEIRIPVARQPEWLDSEFDDDPAMDVYLDGEKQPIDILVNVEDRQDQTILVGIGGEELRDRVQAEYRSEQRYIAAQNLIQNETSYAEDVDTPSATTQTDEPLQNPTMTTDFQDLIDVADTDPINLSNDEVELYKSGKFLDPLFDYQTRQYNGPSLDTTAQGGDYIEIAANGDFVEYELTFNYDVPAPDFSSTPITAGTNDDSRVRLETDNTAPQIEVSIDGNVVRQTTPDTVSETTWEWLQGNSFGNGDVDPYPRIEAGQTVTYRIEVTSETGSQDALQIDCMWLGDQRYTYTFDDSDSDANDTIAGPEEYPDAVRITPAFYQSPFNVTDVAADLTIDDTGNEQLLQVSNDYGNTWKPDDGTEDNTSSVDHTFSNPGAAAQLRFDIGRYSPNGTRSTSPNTGYDTQTVSDWTLTADIDLELLLIDQKYDNALVEVLNDIAGEDFVWSYNLDSSGNPQVSWAEDGQRTADSDPDFSDISIEKDSDTFDRVTIKGSPEDVSEETFTASTSFTALNNTEIVTGSETVYTASTNTIFVRGPDYEMDYSDGEIRIITDGDMTDGTDYTIDYAKEIAGTYPEGVSNPDREFVESVPGVVSDRGAEQIAFVLYSDAKDPRFSGDVTVPKAEVGFDPLESLPLTNVQVPDSATPLEIRGSPQLTPEGIQFRLGSRPPIQQSLGEIANTVSSLSQRS